jgi:hypothetical protein
MYRSIASSLVLTTHESHDSDISRDLQYSCTVRFRPAGGPEGEREDRVFDQTLSPFVRVIT